MSQKIKLKKKFINFFKSLGEFLIKFNVLEAINKQLTTSVNQNHKKIKNQKFFQNFRTVSYPI